MSPQQQPPETAEKAPAEALALRARPRPVARFRRPLLIAIAGVALVGLTVSAWFALSPRGSSSGPRETPPAAGANGAEETLSSLPKDYGQAGPPKLGPPLPGDLGRAIVNNAREAGSGRDVVDPAAKSAQAERERQKAQSRQARESGLMVQIAGPGAAGAEQAPGVQAQTASTPGLTSAIATPSQPSGLLDRPLGQAANSQVIVPPSSPFQVLAGDVIAAALLTGLDSDLPGFVTAQVSENVYDTVSGRYLLIPQGSRLVGEYESAIAFGQSRILLAWRRLILPDGASIQLDNLPAADTSGHAGLKDEVDFHGWALAKSVGMSTLLGIGSELALDGDGDIVQAIRRSSQQAASQSGQQVVGKQLDVRPTLRVRPGWPLRVLIHKDLTLRPWRAPSTGDVP